MQMFNNFILLKLEAEETQLNNGLSVKETRGKRDIVCGKVIKAIDHETFPLAGGDKVLFPLYAANSLTIEGEEYVVVSFEDIILKL